MLQTYIIVVAVMSVITLVTYGRDKLAATQGWSRTPEIVLMTLAALGGAVGALLGSLIFRHKSNFIRKWYIQISIWVGIAIQAAICVLLLAEMGGVL